jgi:hypothetical protein
METVTVVASGFEAVWRSVGATAKGSGRRRARGQLMVI